MPAPATTQQHAPARSPLVLILAVLYLSALFFLTLLPSARPAAETHNLVPFKSIIFGFQRGGPLLVINVIGNIIAFMPLGLLLPALVGRRGWLISVGGGAALSILIELLQTTVARRVSDIDDVLLNMLGALIGYGLYSLLRWLRAQHHDSAL